MMALHLPAGSSSQRYSTHYCVQQFPFCISPRQEPPGSSRHGGIQLFTALLLDRRESHV